MSATQDHFAVTPAIGRYQIDTGSSAVTFATRHLFGLGRVRGTLAIGSGTVAVAEPLAESSIEATIDTASFGTRNPQRDGIVRSAAFLDARRFPKMTFRAGRAAAPGSAAAVMAASPPVAGRAAPAAATVAAPVAAASAPDGRGRLTVPGELTVRDVTRPVVLETEFTAVTPGSFTVRAVTRIDRADFGVTAARGLAGRYLDITLEVQCKRS